MDKKYIILSIAIIMCGLIIGGSLILIQLNKQNSIEKQTQMQIDQEKSIFEAEQKEKEATEFKQKMKKWSLDNCLSKVEESYWTYMELNGIKNDDGTISAATSTWNKADADKQTKIDNCYREYEL
ncbi:MAG: hypothetical protein ACOZBH_04590 [Patescibacteria group bacterium]